MEKLITIREAAKILGMTTRSFRQSFIQGEKPKIPYIKLNRRNYRIRLSDFENFISASEVRPDKVTAGSTNLK